MKAGSGSRLTTTCRGLSFRSRFRVAVGRRFVHVQDFACVRLTDDLLRVDLLKGRMDNLRFSLSRRVLLFHEAVHVYRVFDRHILRGTPCRGICPSLAQRSAGRRANDRAR